MWGLHSAQGQGLGNRVKIPSTVVKLDIKNDTASFRYKQILTCPGMIMSSLGASRSVFAAGCKN